jgi:hypothetical protein
VSAEIPYTPSLNRAQSHTHTHTQTQTHICTYTCTPIGLHTNLLKPYQ